MSGIRDFVGKTGSQQATAPKNELSKEAKFIYGLIDLYKREKPTYVTKGETKPTIGIHIIWHKIGGLSLNGWLERKLGLDTDGRKALYAKLENAKEIQTHWTTGGRMVYKYGEMPTTESVGDSVEVDAIAKSLGL